MTLPARTEQTPPGEPTPLVIARWLRNIRGFSVIPLDSPLEPIGKPEQAGKLPAVQWAPYQQTIADEPTIQGWFGNGHKRNVGIVTGSISKIVVVDMDDAPAIAWGKANLPETPMRTVTSSGEHWFFKHPGVPVRNKARLRTTDGRIKVDVRADGGYVVAAGSLHRSGCYYRRAGNWNASIDELPVFDLAWIAPPPEVPPAPPRPRDQRGDAVDRDGDDRLARAAAYVAAIPPAIEGQGGDEHTYGVCCRVVRGFDLSDHEAIDILSAWNASCVPPWSEAELLEKIAGARKYGTELIGGRLDDRPSRLKLAASRSVSSGQNVHVESPAEKLDQNDPTATDDFKRRSGGAVQADSIENVRLGLRRLGLDLHYNTFARYVVIDGKPLDDSAIDRVWISFDDEFAFRPSKDLLHTVITTEAGKVLRHPVCEYLDGLTWDGHPRLDNWLVTYGAAVASDYVSAAGALPLIAAVHRVRNPGAQFDELLVLEGVQGGLKSTTIRMLCPNEDWFSDDLPLGVDSKQVIERTAGRWIVEAAEMHGNRGREAEALKAFLSRRVDGPVRLAYDRLPTSVPRQFVLVGTTNATAGYLKDTTGGRRFWPVQVRRFDIQAIRRDRDQLWAEAAVRASSGASTRLDASLWADAGTHQERRRAADPWEELLEPLMDSDDNAVSVEAIWATLGVQASLRDNRHADRVSAILQRHGYTTKRKFRRDGGKPAWHWERENVPTSAEQ